MATPPNLTRETATEITTLPASITLDLGGAPPSSVWYSYTAAGSVIHLSVYAWADDTLYPTYLPTWVLIYEGASETPFLSFDTLLPDYHSYLVPLDTGTTYYIEIHNKAGGSANPAVLELSVQATPNLAVPDGSILVNDDTVGYDRAAVISSTDGAFLKSVAYEPGEYADILDDGTILTEVLGSTNLHLRNADLSLRAVVAGAWQGDAEHPRIRAALTEGAFYVLECDFYGDSNGRRIRRVSADGVVSGAWTLPTHTDWEGVLVFAVSPDGAIAYYDYYNWDTERWYIARYDLVNSVALSDLVELSADTGGPHIGNGYHYTEAFTLADGSIFIALDSPSEVVRYSSAGALLNTYPDPTSGINRIARGVNNDTFWVWEQAFGPPYESAEFVELDIATGAELTRFDEYLFLQGVSGVVNEHPDDQPRFGISSSCPILILRSIAAESSSSPSSSPSVSASASVSLSPSASIEEEVRLIRRLRQTPHLNDEQIGFFISRIQLDLETGRGLTTGQGIDPQIMMQWSDDGGKTWSSEQWVSAGVQGAYRWRAIWYRLGRSRDRVWRFVMSDPVPWRLLDLYGQLEQGTT